MPGKLGGFSGDKHWLRRIEALKPPQLVAPNTAQRRCAFL
jgi:hypothetical protein